MEFIALLFLFISIELIYFKIADRYNIIDKPNSRSSHSVVTIRGGGVLFPIAVITAYLLSFTSWKLAAAVFLVGIISFIDDIKPLSQLPRFASHIVAVLLIFYDLELFTHLLWLLPVALILMIGWVNAFNFMDGINGITVLYSLIAIISFAILDVNAGSIPLLITVGMSCFVFGLFNVRKKAKTFAGDVGSISLAVFLGYMMIKTILETGNFAFILFFCVYGIDAIFTIVTRIVKKENIFEAHRSHLYQYLANERGYSHVKVAVIYAGIQLIINGLLIYLNSEGYLTIYFSLTLLLFLTIIYLLIRNEIVKKSIIKY